MDSIVKFTAIIAVSGFLGAVLSLSSGEPHDAPEASLVEDAPAAAALAMATSAPADAAISTETAATTSEVAAVPSTPTLDAVIEVVDGDTLKVRMGAQTETVRLIGLDTPETVHPSKPVECFGKEASSRARTLLTGKRVRLETDPSQDTRDRYGRLLAYVFLEDGTLVNQLMIVEGYGHEYTYNLPYKYQAEFQAAEAQARAAQRGLWAPGACESAASEPQPAAAKAAEQPSSEPQPETRPTPEPQPASATPSGYTCSADAYNCGDFASHAQAQAAYEACGGLSNDVHGLDRDKDGSACDSLR